MTTFLDQLLDGARRRVAAAQQQRSLEELQEQARRCPDPPGLRAALAGPGVSVIAEIKRASPSKGDLAPRLGAATQAGHYRQGGAQAISVLTEPERFKGSLEDLRSVSALGTPTIRKDFLVDAYQVWEARLAGASAVLLIVAALPAEQLRHLQLEAETAGLETLVEVHDERELETAGSIGAGIVGVNARDLRTFEVDRGVFARLRPGFPQGTLAVAESGIRGPEDVRTAGAAGADAVLVGESLVTGADPSAAVAALVAAGRDVSQHV